MRSSVGVAVSAVVCGLVAPAVGAPSYALVADTAGDDDVSLLQRRSMVQGNRVGGARDLVLMHVPFNFGHTVENVAMFGSSGIYSQLSMGAYLMTLGGFSEQTRQASWEEANMLTRPKGAVWGHLNPDLQVMNEATGCPMYYAPQKYWPKELAEKYFGNKTVFGMLRDPYERLIAFFRGNMDGYGGVYPEYFKKCDVNGAVKQMMKDYIEGNNTFSQDCTFVPQAEYFDGPHGIALPINNRQFPASMNTAFVEHGYTDYQIHTEDILHVRGCPDVWAADLDEETRSLVRQVYARDFELLCKHFNYCDSNENTCIWQVPMMCPQKVLAQGYKGHALNATQ